MIHIGKRMVIRSAAFVFSENHQSVLSFGDDVILDENVIISPRKGNITIGCNVFIGPFSIIQAYNGGDIVIGNNVMIAKGVNIFASNHDISDPPHSYMKEAGKPVHIEDDVWIGSNAVINAGVVIGKGSIIGSGSVVTRDILPFTINAGNPCRVIKRYDFNKCEWMRHFEVTDQNN